ncbi:hypothetical protein FXF53_19840 [Micromonospora sp. WP24]|uniref:hypothetical protein n=1 Tax=Micromonospora sp. WP24 TaxID=2604469 RepID=UPI0011D712D4|nr:hypothetical protein [Micromonospora sp. WP24]TYB97409.1 hypothetical protein FXF53_19840 [Micromonospora sp. WP24]
MLEVGSIVDRNGYMSVRSHAATVFHLDSRLPHQVFKEDASDSLFCEFDAVLAPDFWPTFCAMARWHGDQRVELLVLEPDCDTYYLPKYRMYPAISLPIEASVEDYWAAIGYEPPGESYESMAITANVIAVTGASGKWGCWGERESEVAVFRGFPDAASRSEWRAQFGPFLEVSEALDSYFPWTFRGRSAPDGYVAELTTNYGRREGVQP